MTGSGVVSANELIPISTPTTLGQPPPAPQRHREDGDVHVPASRTRLLQLATTGLLALVAVALVGWLLLRPAPAVEGAGTSPGLAAAGSSASSSPSSSASSSATPSDPLAAQDGLTTPVPGATVAAPTGTLTAAAPTASTAAPAASVAGGVPVLFVGDGLDPSGAANDWSALAATALAGGGSPLARTVAAADGAGWATTSADGRSFAQLVTAATPQTRLVVLLGSRNDLADPAAAGRGAAAALAAAREAAPQARLLVVAPPALAGDGGATQALADQRAALAAAAAGAGAYYLDPATQGPALDAAATSSAGGAVRLTTAGQVQIADLVLPALQRLVAGPSATS